MTAYTASGHVISLDIRREKQRVYASVSAHEPPIVERLKRSKWLRVDVVAVLALFAAFAYLLFPIAGAPSVYPDSGTVLSISKTLSAGELKPLLETQSPPLQNGVYALILVLGWPILHYPIVLASFALAALLGFFAYRATGDILASAAPAVVLLFSEVFWLQAGYLSFYATFVVLGYAGLYFALRYLVRGGSGRDIFVGTALLAASVYAYTTALVFLLIPIVALACFYSEERRTRAVVLYAALWIFMMPWLIWHLSVGGVRYFFYHPLNWFTVRYLDIVNTQFWGHERQSLPSYANDMGSLAIHELLPLALLMFVVPGLWWVARNLGVKSAVFCVSSLTVYGLLLLITRPAPYARYFFPILPLVVLLASAGVWAGLSAIGRVLGRRALATAILMGALLLLLGEVPSAVNDAHFKFVERLDSSPGYADYLAMGDLISETDGGIVARDSAIQYVVPGNQVFTHFLLTEEDYVTYLAWSSDLEVAQMFRKRDIEWVLLYQDLRWERDYHVWLRAGHGLEPQHYRRVAISPLFERVYSGSAYSLYHLRDDVLASD